MNCKVYFLLTTPLIAMLAACGGSSGGSAFTLGDTSDPDPGTISIGFSDAPVDDAKEVVIEVDTITLKRSGDDVVIETFTSSDLDIIDAETFQINLLDYQGSDQAIVIEDLEVPSGTYTSVELTILNDEAVIDDSYVIEVDDTQKILKIPSDDLKLDGFVVDEPEEEGDTQTFTIDFNLRQSMTYNPGQERYILKPNGIRVQDNSGDRTIRGDVDSGLFDTEEDCADKEDPTAGNIIYLYEGTELGIENLADMFDEDNSSTDIPDGAIAPYAVVAVMEDGMDNWAYEFAYLPAGEYTLVFTCDAVEDDPDDYDGLTLPLPEEQIIELSTASASAVCDLPIVDNECS
ncbi:DUF4382 domain-containing protein [Oceanicoccus sagamiensis]|uniref:DUF4382 domain-containing protein n=1 Tax=Oceanicoccus sagamiensis TaxID=716816 RepID=A0A1X9N7R5_9GAMM|nr:DUF4382 domain-containing protein [Oceanicoccus sagamiensis]ARN74110.1 hypothetical protein BST96_08230 [Oceanicoccus sagamiensis]